MIMRPGVTEATKSFGVTFTFTHTYVKRFLGDGLIGEDADPELTLTLHVARHGDTCCLDLAAGNPFRLKSLDTERAEGKLVAALRVAFGTAFLHAAEFCFLGL